MSVLGKEETWVVSLDTMTHPSTRAGLLSRVAEPTYRDLARLGLPVVWGFPNERIHTIRIKKLNWFDIGLLDVYIKPVGLSRSSTKLKRLGPLRYAAPWLNIAFRSTRGLQRGAAGA